MTERRFKALVEQVPAITYTWNPTTTADEVSTVYISPQVERMIGYTPEDWLSSPTFWNEHIHSDDRQQVVEASARADREGTSFNEEYRIIAKDGRIVWVRDEAWAVAIDANGRPELMQGVMYDITQQKEAEERTQDAENRYRMIVERVPTVAYSWDSADAPGTAPAAYISPADPPTARVHGAGVARGPDALGIAGPPGRSTGHVAGVGGVVAIARRRSRPNTACGRRTGDGCGSGTRPSRYRSVDAVGPSTPG